MNDEIFNVALPDGQNGINLELQSYFDESLQLEIYVFLVIGTGAVSRVQGVHLHPTVRT